MRAVLTVIPVVLVPRISTEVYGATGLRIGKP